jgi:predicted RNA-binding Zn-ribbon protein involved in translation (DUF1610 family)
MAYVHSVQCPTKHEWVEVCTADKFGYEMGTRFTFQCPRCGESHVLSTMAVEILDDNEPCPKGSVEGKPYTAVTAN